MAFDTSLENLLSLLPALRIAGKMGINPSHELIWADGGYAGKLIKYVAEIPRRRRVKIEIVPKRWIVERIVRYL